MKFSAILLLFLTFSFSCIRFKLNELKENTISRIQIGEGINKIEAEIVNNTLTNIHDRNIYQDFL